MFRCFSIAFLFLLANSPVIGQERLSLADAIARGLENNFQIQISKRNMEIAERNNTWKATGRYPSINLNAGFNNSLSGQNNPNGFLQESRSIGSGLTGNIDVGWTLFDGYKVNINKERLEQLEMQSKSNSKLVVENTVQQIILSYYTALIQKEQIEVLKEILDLSYDRIAYQEVKKEYGQAGTFDILQTKDAYLNDSTNYLLQLHTYDIALNNLNLAMGEQDLSIRFDLTDPLDYQAQAYALEDLKEKMFASNRDLENRYINRELAHVERKLQESNKYPRVGVNGGLNLGGDLSNLNVIKPTTFEGGTNISNNYNLYLNFSATYNLYDGGSRQRLIENAKVQEMTAQLSIDDLKRNLSGQVQNLLANYNNQVKILSMTETIIDNARQNLEIATSKFKAGQISSFDYRSIQLSLVNASQSRLQAIYNLMNTETEMVRLIGGLVD